MSFRSSSLILLFFFFGQCDSLFNNENGRDVISAVIEGDELVIRNGLHFDIYFFAVDQETSFLINWAPYKSEENLIRAKRGRAFSTDLINSYDPDKTVIVFIWGNDQTYWDGIEIEP